MILKELTEKLNNRSQEVQMSRIVLINGKHRAGKSELVRSYAYSKKSNVWTNVIQINAETYGALSHSFRNLTKELRILQKIVKKQVL
ncbi:MAG: hypothetical protein ACR5KV_00880 [Wolbachia sp.]